MNAWIDDDVKRIHEIEKRYHTDDPYDISDCQIGFDVGWLVGVIYRLLSERRELLAKLSDLANPQ